MEELFLDPLFARKKLNIIDQQHVDVAVALPELREAVFLQWRDRLFLAVKEERAHRRTSNQQDNEQRTTSAAAIDSLRE